MIQLFLHCLGYDPQAAKSCENISLLMLGEQNINKILENISKIHENTEK